jgi:hypothetical protein
MLSEYHFLYFITTITIYFESFKHCCIYSVDHQSTNVLQIGTKKRRNYERTDGRVTLDLHISILTLLEN